MLDHKSIHNQYFNKEKLVSLSCIRNAKGVPTEHNSHGGLEYGQFSQNK
jgi:hypothetical protein